MCDVCESPNEKKFHEAWIKLYPKDMLQCQYTISKCRIDFVYIQSINWCNKHIEFKIAIEIDSKEYHSTVAQLKKDKARDNFLRGQGFHIIRMYGPNVFYNPLVSVNIAHELMIQYMYGYLTAIALVEGKNSYRYLYRRASNLLMYKFKDDEEQDLMKTILKKMKG